MFSHSSFAPDLRHHHFLSRISVIAFLLTCGLCMSASATTRNVPTQYATIQAAINASVNGDTVLISDGTYTGDGNRDLDFGGRNITVTSVNGPDKTIINCQGSAAHNHRGFYLHRGETSAVISGLTIENGFESLENGGAIANVNVNVTIQHCVIQNNTAFAGGGIANSPAALITVTDCIITGNTATDANGGGEGGPSGFGGGGIYNYTDGTTGMIIVTNCSLTKNTVTSGNGGGGGIYNTASGGTITVSNCSLIGNTANTHGINFADNGGGGGIFNYGSSNTLTITNCSLINNTTNSSGGGMYNEINHGTITNCTLTGNTALNGSGIYNTFYSLYLTNVILYGDIGSEIYINNGTVIAAYCDIEGGYTGTHNINVDPLFVKFPDDAPLFPADLHLLAGSACLGAGSANSAPTKALDGRLRPNPPSIGAYELDIRIHTNTALTSNLNPSVTGQNVTLTATVAGDGGPPTGSVRFSIDGVVKSTLALSNGGVSYAISSLAVGAHSVYVSYSGDANFTPGVSPTLTQTVQPVAVSSISFSPSSITGIGNLTGTLVLNAAAPSGNAIVTLSSSNPSAFYVPASAQLNVGLVSRTFTGTSRFVNVSTPVTVTATYGGVSKTTVVTINPVIATALTSITFSPSNITGAGNVTGTLTLNGVAPATNAVVQLTSSNPNALYVPPTAQLNSGVTSRTFTATSRLVTTPTNVTVTATWAGGSKTAIVTVQPITATAIASVSFSPSSITGIGNLTGTLALNGIAPAGNAVVHLSSSNPAALYVPATAQINAGLISRTFTATARPVTSTTSVTVTATWPGASVTTTVTLHPLTISSVSFSPSSISGAGNVTGTLTLTGPAPSANAVVQLTSSNPNALFVPATAQINSGVSSRTFTAVSHAVSTSTHVTVTASYGGVSKTTTVTVNP